MPTKVEITEQELKTRQSVGSVFLCKMCKDARNKIIMTDYFEGTNRGIFYNFCKDCTDLMKKCTTCRK